MADASTTISIVSLVFAALSFAGTMTLGALAAIYTQRPKLDVKTSLGILAAPLGGTVTTISVEVTNVRAVPVTAGIAHFKMPDGQNLFCGRDAMGGFPEAKHLGHGESVQWIFEWATIRESLDEHGYESGHYEVVAEVGGNHGGKFVSNSCRVDPEIT